MPENVNVTKTTRGHVFHMEHRAMVNFDCVGWQDMGDGWEIWSDGKTLPEPRRIYEGNECEVIGADGSRVPVLPIHDRHGRQWFVPAILSPAGDPLLARTYSRVNGHLEITYDDQQQAIIDTATEARRCLINEDLDEILGGEMASDLIAWAYHIPPEAVCMIGLLDTGMILRTLLNAAGVWTNGEA